MNDLFFGLGAAHSILLLGFVIAIGLLLGRLHIKGISLGATWILFVGIAFSHFGLRMDGEMLHFLKEFGLILFVFSIGLQVGPGFFHSFKAGGFKLNLLATALVLLAVLTTYVIHLLTGETLETMTGVMSGAVTNTPGLGAAQQTFFDMNTSNGMAKDVASSLSSGLASGYAIAYPMGVVGVIVTLIIIKAVFKIDINNERAQIDAEDTHIESAVKLVFKITNPAIFNIEIQEVDKQITNKFVISRIYRNGAIELPLANTHLEEGDQVLVITSADSTEVVKLLFGELIEYDKNIWNKFDASLMVKTLTVTKNSVNGKTLKSLRIRSTFGISVTKILRSGATLAPNPNLRLQIGDIITVVGPEATLKKVSKLVGNSIHSLSHPNLIPIFAGIGLGVLLGSIPFKIPGIPQAIKLGLAGGPLIVAILIGYFGPRLKITTYTTTSANMMIREIGISIFLAAVGLGAGETFVDSILNGGYNWALYGILITMIPTLLIGIIARLVFKLNFYQICGLVSGGCTNPPVLAFAQNAYGTDHTSVSYATVYPLTMFLRVLVAQLLILFALA